MSPRCDLDLEDWNNNSNNNSAWLSGSWCCITIPNLVTKCSVLRKYHPDKHSLTFWTFAVTLTLKAVIPFFHRMLWLAMLDYQTKSGSKPTSSSEDTTEIVVFWLYKPLLWPWPWTQRTYFSACHSGLWCCTTTPGLVTKCSVLQKISSKQTFINILNLRCDLDLERSKYVFPHGIKASDAVLQNHVWSQTDQQFRRYSENSHILIKYAITVTLTLKIVNHFFCMTLHLMIIHNYTKFG